MKYSETGNFTPEMVKLAKEIKSRINKLRKLGCVVLGKQCYLEAYLTKDYKHCSMEGHYNPYRLKNLNCGEIDDSGADDEECFGKIFINYVHELQHAIRLCKIDKEIEL